MSWDLDRLLGRKNVGLVGMFSPLVALGAILVAIILNSSWFSWTDNALSDLGNYGRLGLLALPFNLGLILTGVCTFFFAVGVIRILNTDFEGYFRFLAVFGGFLLILTSVVLVCIGIFSEDFRPFHYYFSVLFFLLLPFTMLSIALAMLSKDELRIYGVLGIFVAGIAAITWILYYNFFEASILPGNSIAEAISSFSIGFWNVIYAYRIYKLA